MLVREDEDGNLFGHLDGSEERSLDVRGWASPAAFKQLMATMRVWSSAPGDLVLSIQPATNRPALEAAVLPLRPFDMAAGDLGIGEPERKHKLKKQII